MERREVNEESVKRFAERSTTASARIERREVPASYVRPAKVERFLAQRQTRG